MNISNVCTTCAGYLPLELQPSLKVLRLVCVSYLSLALAWTVAHVRHWRGVAAVQHCITAVMALSLLEASTW